MATNSHPDQGSNPDILDVVTLPFAALPFVRGYRRQRAVQRRLRALRTLRVEGLSAFGPQHLTPPREIFDPHPSPSQDGLREEQAA